MGEHLFDCSFDFWHPSSRVEVSSRCELCAYEEFSKVPGDHAAAPCPLIKQITVPAQTAVDFIGVFPVDFALCEEGESGAVTFTGELFDLRVGALFLLSKLVAGEGKDFETLVPILLIQICQLSVVFFS